MEEEDAEGEEGGGSGPTSRPPESEPQQGERAGRGREERER